MGLRIRRSVKLMPGVRLNIGKRGMSISAGKRGATVNLSKRGVRTTVGIPGTGISYSTLSKPSAPVSAPTPVNTTTRERAGSGIGIGILLVLGAFIVIAVARSASNSSSSGSTSSSSTYVPPATIDAGLAIDASNTVETPPAIYAPSGGKQCSRGCACGDTCISCDKVCHVGAGTSRHHRRR